MIILEKTVEATNVLYNLIPKKIHYCWFGGNQLPEKVQSYINTWKEKCPDYEIIQWDETNFDIHCCEYVEQAYNAKKWAFVADYARFYAIYKEGGIYLDTDIELLKNLDELLFHNVFFGFGRVSLTVPVFGGIAGHPCILDILQYYNTRKFIMDDGKLDMTTIEHTVEMILTKKYHLVMNGKQQILDKDIIVYPKEYFLARDYRTGIIDLNPHLYLIHYGDGTWLDDKERELLKEQHKLVKIFGVKIGVLLGPVVYYIKKEGILKTCIRIVRHFIKRVSK